MAKKHKKQKQSFVQGAMILSVSLIIVKIIGFVYKVVLQQIIQDDGMGYYDGAYSIFAVVLTIATAGLPVAIARLIASNTERKNYKNILKIKNIAIKICAFTGLSGTVLILALSYPITRSIIDEGSLYAILAISPAIFFICLMSAYRGYYNGLQNMYPQGISEVIESIFRIVMGLGLSIIVKKIGLDQYNKLGTVFGQSTVNGEPIDSKIIALRAIAPYSAAAAILGVTISTLAGFVFLYIYTKINGTQITKREIILSPEADKTSDLARQLVKIAVPIAIGSLVMSLSSMIDTSTIQNRINFAIQKNPAILSTEYAQTLINMGAKKLADGNYDLSSLSIILYGIYTRTTGVFALIPSFTNYFGISILPQVTHAWIRKDQKYMQQSVQSVLKITSLLALPASFLIIAHAEDFLSFAYPNSPNSNAIAGPLLSGMGVSIFLVSLATLVNSMLQAIGRADLPVKYMGTGVAIKLISNYILIGIPEINIKGVPIGTLLCYLFMLIAGLYSLLSITNVKVNYKETFVKPTISAFLSIFGGIVLKEGIKNLIKIENYGINVLILGISVAFSGVFYVILLFIMGGITKSDIILLPKGKNIAKTLEKFKIIR